MRLPRLVLVLCALVSLATAARADCPAGTCSDANAISTLRAQVAATCDCAAAASPRAWRRCVQEVVETAVAAGTPRACGAAVRRCEARATCGRAQAVVCCSAGGNGRVVPSARRCRGTVCGANPYAADACRRDATCVPPPRRDPGTGEWVRVPRDRVGTVCGLDPALLDAADAILNTPYAIVRYGRLCHEFYPEGFSGDKMTEAFSTTKTLGALVTGIAAYQTRDLVRTGRKTGPLLDTDRVDHWLDSFTFNPDAQIAHVLAMVAHNADLGYGAKEYQYDFVGAVQINRLNDVVRTAIAQDPARFGPDLEVFTQRFLFQPVGMTNSVWTGGKPDKTFGFTWGASVHDMARVGLLMLNDGMWNGERILDAEWVYRMTHAVFEDSNLSYGYLTWLSTDSEEFLGACAPPAIHATYPHGLSPAPDCGFTTRSCTQTHDVGVWSAVGLFGQIISGHRGLDLVLVAKDVGEERGARALWDAVRPALVARDPRFGGDDAAFCAAYDASDYAPDLR